jgi:hypothetical protein
MAQKSGIHEIEFGTLDEPFREVLMMRRELVKDIAGAKYGKPSPGRDMGDSGIRAQGRRVQKGTHPTCTQTHKPGEGIHVADSRHMVNIPLHIGPNITVQPHSGIQVLVMNAREESLEQGFV